MLTCLGFVADTGRVWNRMENWKCKAIHSRVGFGQTEITLLDLNLPLNHAYFSCMGVVL